MLYGKSTWYNYFLKLEILEDFPFFNIIVKPWSSFLCLQFLIYSVLYFKPVLNKMTI